MGTFMCSMFPKYGSIFCYMEKKKFSKTWNTWKTSMSKVDLFLSDLYQLYTNVRAQSIFKCIQVKKANSNVCGLNATIQIKRKKIYLNFSHLYLLMRLFKSFGCPKWIWQHFCVKKTGPLKMTRKKCTNVSFYAILWHATETTTSRGNIHLK